MNDKIEDTRQPQQFLTYNNDVTSILDNLEKPVGPSYMGEWWFPVTAEYDPETNKTRVGFTLEMPPSLRQVQEVK